MILQFLELDTRITDFANQIGKIIQKEKHFACNGIPIICPYVYAMDANFVQIAVGVGPVGQIITVAVPIPLFERGADKDIRAWVQMQNQVQRERELDTEEFRQRAKREKEIAILRELRDKYPNE
jgi:hypothetical protein